MPCIIDLLSNEIFLAINSNLAKRDISSISYLDKIFYKKQVFFIAKQEKVYYNKEVYCKNKIWLLSGNANAKPMQLSNM